jgi:hypothetical protein
MNEDVSLSRVLSHIIGFFMEMGRELFVMIRNGI